MINRQENKITIELKSEGKKEDMLWFWFDLGSEMGFHGHGVRIDENIYYELRKYIKDMKSVGVEYVNLKEVYDACSMVLSMIFCKREYINKWEMLYYPEDWKKNNDRMHKDKPTYEKDNGSSYVDISFNKENEVPYVDIKTEKTSASIQIDKYIFRNICDEVYYYTQQGLINSGKQYGDIIGVFKKVNSYLKSHNITPISNNIEREEVNGKYKKKFSDIEVEDANKYYSKSKTYIMKDNHNNLYKIGKSINPRVRERTLQSEKPSINIVKIFNKDIERKLHEDYSKYRVRGEWFRLNKVQVKYICTHYNK